MTAGNYDRCEGGHEQDTQAAPDRARTRRRLKHLQRVHSRHSGQTADPSRVIEGSPVQDLTASETIGPIRTPGLEHSECASAVPVQVADLRSQQVGLACARKARVVTRGRRAVELLFAFPEFGVQRRA